MKHWNSTLQGPILFWSLAWNMWKMFTSGAAPWIGVHFAWHYTAWGGSSIFIHPRLPCVCLNKPVTTSISKVEYCTRESKVSAVNTRKWQASTEEWQIWLLSTKGAYSGSPPFHSFTSRQIHIHSAGLWVQKIYRTQEISLIVGSDHRPIESNIFNTDQQKLSRVLRRTLFIGGASWRSG